MALTPLATVQDVQKVLGRDLTTSEQTRADAILEKVSAQFRRLAGQTFTPQQSTVWLTVRDGIIRLPQKPVTYVAAVRTADGTDVPATLAGTCLLVAPALTDRQLQVTYVHGGDVPDLVRTTVADIAQKVLTIPEDAAAGVQQKTTSTGPFNESFTYAQWALGGQASFSPNDEAIARSYRPVPIGSIRVR